MHLGRLGNFFKYCLLVTATFVLLLHSFIPHQHHNNSPAKVTVSSCVHSENSLFGFLSKAFHLDLGSDHLENFKPAQKVDLFSGLLMIAGILNFQDHGPGLADRPNHILPVFISFIDQYSKGQIQLRGPPGSEFYTS